MMMEAANMKRQTVSLKSGAKQAVCKRWLAAAVRCAKWIGLIQLCMERTLRRFPLPQRQQALERLCEGDCSEEKTSGISVCGHQ